MLYDQTRLNQHRSKIYYITGHTRIYSFWEFLPEEYRGNGRDIKRDYNSAYFIYSFSYSLTRDKVQSYFNSKGQRVSFEEVFEACCEETQNYILFNLDFFNPSKNNG